MPDRSATPKKITRALLSVTDKTGIVELARFLSTSGVDLISTGGTANLLRAAGIAVRDVSDLTGFPEMLDGRVKTLHPKVHGGILHVRDNPGHRAQVEEQGILPIDMVVVNLYQFEQTAARAGVQFDELIENIDIGGPSMIRSAAKNFRDVAVLTEPGQYRLVQEEMLRRGNALAAETRWRLAQAAFAATAAYDGAIASALERIQYPKAGPLDQSISEFPAVLRLTFRRSLSLRYGENPHQRAAMYTDGGTTGVVNGLQLQGKELSYNNIVDLDAAWVLAQEFLLPSCAIIKHTNPCGAATGKDIREAYERALETDPVSAFGGVIGVNRPVDEAAAAAMAKLFLEAIAAPEFTAEALRILSGKKNLRLIQVTNFVPKFALKQVSGGMLAQDPDLLDVQLSDLKTVTERQPGEQELRDLLFAWKVCKHVKSNAIVYARDGRTVGVGAGQMSRVDSARIGAQKAVLPLSGTVVASDAFFPFADGVEEIAKAGATSIIQPGGSMRDEEVIAAANRLGLAMVFTGVRHFRH